MPPKRKKVGKTKGTRKKKVKPINEMSPSNMVKKEEEQMDQDEAYEDYEDPDIESDEQNGEAEETQVVLEVRAKKPTIACKECSKKFRFKNSFKKHLLHEHSKLPGSVACDRCPVRCPNRAKLEEHIAKFHDRQLYACTQCNKTFVRHAHVLRHMAQKGCDGTKTIIYPCEICGAQFSRKDNLMVHLRQQHIMRKKFACKECSFSTSTFSKLCIHKNKYHMGEEKRRYECDHCGKVVTSRPAMCKHLEIHGEKKFACDVCGYSTFTIEVMRRHVLTHVEEKPYKCGLCDVSFIQRAQLQRHVAGKHSDKMQCPNCKIAFKSRSKFIDHMKLHTGLNELECPIETCKFYKKEFKSKQELRSHMNLHFVERPCSCEVCGKTFRNSMDMKRHVTSHTLERPRRCMYCVQARAYVRGIQLVRHVRKMHPQVFKDHLTHVRQVLGSTLSLTRVRQSELDSILNVLDAEADRILEGYGEGVLYGGMQETGPDAIEVEIAPPPCKSESSPLMSEEELAENLNMLLFQLIDKELLEHFGWPTESVDTVLEKVIENCGAKPADRGKWTRVQRLRENAKHLFLHVLEDKNITRMLDSHTIDQIVKHILRQVAGDNPPARPAADHSSPPSPTPLDSTN